MKSRKEAELPQIFKTYRKWEILIIFFKPIVPNFYITFIPNYMHWFASCKSYLRANYQHFLCVSTLLIMVEIFTLICSLLDVASKALVSSNNLISSLSKRKSESFSKSSFVGRYMESMRPLRIYMGPFHVVDRGRVPLLLLYSGYNVQCCL